jgi:hypothetical protein
MKFWQCAFIIDLSSAGLHIRLDSNEAGCALRKIIEERLRNQDMGDEQIADIL